MKIIVLSLSLLLFFSCARDQQKKVAFYNYSAYLPPDYEIDKTGNWPLILFLHGASLRGDSLEKINKFGLPKLINQGEDFDFIIVSPQCPLYKDWSSDAWFPPLYKDIIRKYRIDTNRIYLTGLSMGGEGTWYISERYPTKFAAIAPICGRVSNISGIEQDISKIAQLPVWIFHGDQDRIYPVEESDKMYDRLNGINANVKYTRYKGFGHWETHDSTYKNKNLYRWFLSHELK